MQNKQNVPSQLVALQDLAKLQSGISGAAVLSVVVVVVVVVVVDKQ